MNIRRTSRWTSLFLVVALLLTVSGLVLAAEKTIVIVNTSDFHGNLLAGQKDKATGRPLGSAATVAAEVAKVRAQYPGSVLLFDEGDLMQGPAISTALRGKSVIDVYNLMGYNASGIGNHEFDWGLDVLTQRVSQAKFPFLSANIFLKGSNQRPAWAKPYAIFDVNGVKVAAIGVTTPTTPVVTLPATVAGLDFRDPVTVINSLVSEVRGAGAQIIVVIAHMGGDLDKQGALTDEVATLSQGVKGVDLILGGHSHTLVVSKAGVPVVIPGTAGKNFGVTVVNFDTAQNKVTKVDPQLFTAWGDEVTPDAAVQAVVDQYNKDLGPVMAEVLNETPVDLTRNYDREAAVSNLVADIMLKAVKADMAFTNAGGLRVDIPAGQLTLGRVWEVMPFDNTLVTMDLKGSAILDVLANKTKGMVQLAGLRFTYRDGSDPAKREVVDAFLSDGTRLDPNKTYKVVTNNFMATGGDNYVSFKTGANVVDTNILIRDAIANYFRSEAAAGRKINPVVDGRATQLQ